MTPVERYVRAEIARRGPIPFEDVIEAALYDPVGGFYSSSGRAGRSGDFLTSPEVGPLFGAVVANALDSLWVASGRPDVFVVVEAGAGAGTLAASVLAAAPACSAALRYMLVERSATLRAAQADHLELDDPDRVIATSIAPVASARATGWILVSLAELPSRVPGACVVLANELLDNMPFNLLERTSAGWSEVRVGVEGDSLVEVLLPASDRGDLPPADPWGRVPLQARAAAWVEQARGLAGEGGRVIAFDYASSTAALAQRPWTEWVRTYRGHRRGGPVLDALGTQDITCEVALDQLPEPAFDTSQAEWLRAHGIEQLVDRARRHWHERSSIGDLDAVRARSRVNEAAALVDPGGLGAFRVLEWPGH